MNLNTIFQQMSFNFIIFLLNLSEIRMINIFKVKIFGFIIYLFECRCQV